MKKLTAFSVSVLLALSMLPGIPRMAADAAADVSQLSPNEETYAFIKELEGCNYECVWDSQQWTIGFGNRCPYTHTENGTKAGEKGGHTITEAEAKKLFNERIDSYVTNLRTNCKGISMNQYQFDALLSVTYNHGNARPNGCSVCGYAKQPLVQYLLGNLSASDAYNMHCEWIVMKGTPYEKGLRARRKKEAERFFKGDPPPDPDPDTELGIPYPRPTGDPLIEMGSKGSDVSWVQYALQKLGYDIGPYGIDGDFGDCTRSAVMAYQADRGLEVDGQIGPLSVASIVSDLKPDPPPGKPQPSVTAGDIYTPVEVHWSSCEHTDHYALKISRQDGTAMRSVQPYTGTSYQLSLTAGDYSATVTAFDQKGRSTVSDSIAFTVADGTTAPTVRKAFGGHLYSVYDAEMWYTNAEATAKRFGGHLATITSQEENDFITSLIENGKHAAYWIGGTDRASEGSFAWSTGEAMAYQNWAANQPDDYAQNEDCMEIYRSGQWNDDQNEVFTRGFILEIEPLTPVASTVCRSNAYQLFDTTMTWTDARTYCEMLGGHLVQIETEDEQAAVYDMVKQGHMGAYWLGGIRKNGAFEWIDASAIGYSHWQSAQPDNYKGLEFYMEMYTESGTWNDNKNTGGRGFICEFDNANALEIPETLTLQIGGSYTVSAKARAIRYQTHNKRIADVSPAGEITAAAAGTAVISVIDEDANVYQIKVTVLPAALPGDCDQSGAVDKADVTALLGFLTGRDTAAVKSWQNADLNGDGRLNAIDLTLLKRLLLTQ